MPLPSPTLPPSNANGPSRRAGIVAAAVRVLANRGLSGLSMQAVAVEAGVPKSVVVYHVGDRSGLLVAVASAVAESQRVIDAVLESPGGDPRQHLADWLTVQWEAARRPDSPTRLAWLLRLDAELGAPGPRSDPAERRRITALQGLLQRGVHHAGWTCPDPSRTAQRVLALVDGFLLQLFATSEDPAADRKLMAACRGAVLDLLVRQSP